MNGKAEVTVNAIPLTGVRMVSFDLKDVEDLAARIAGLHSFTATLRGQWVGSARWWVYPDRSRRRLTRMHTAYGRRRGRGRW